MESATAKAWELSKARLFQEAVANRPFFHYDEPHSRD